MMRAVIRQHSLTELMFAHHEHKVLRIHADLQNELGQDAITD